MARTYIAVARAARHPVKPAHAVPVAAPQWEHEHLLSDEVGHPAQVVLSAAGVELSSFSILRKSVAHLLVASAELEADLVGEDLVSVDGAAAWTHEDWVYVVDIGKASSMITVTVVTLRNGLQRDE